MHPPHKATVQPTNTNLHSVHGDHRDLPKGGCSTVRPQTPRKGKVEENHTVEEPCDCNKPDCVKCMVQSIDINPPEIYIPQFTSIHLHIHCKPDKSGKITTTSKNRLENVMTVVKSIEMLAESLGFKTTFYTKR